MTDLPPLPDGFVIEDQEPRYDPMKDILSSGYDFTNGYRTKEDIERLKRAGYKPAEHSKHLEGDAIDLVPGKSGKSMQDVLAFAEQLKEKWGKGAVLMEGDHVHLTLPGWGQAPGTPGTPYSGMPDVPDGFQVEQRGAVSKADLTRDYSGMVGDRTETTVAPAGSEYKTVADPDAEALIDSSIRQGIPYAQALDAVRAKFPEYPGFAPGEYNAALDYHSKHPDYSGSFAAVTKAVPLTEQERAANDVAQSGVGALAGHFANSMTAGAPVAAAGETGNYWEDLSAQEHPVLSTIGDLAGTVAGAVVGGKAVGAGAKALAEGEGALAIPAGWVLEHPGLTQSGVDLAMGAGYGAAAAGEGHRLEGAAYGAATTAALEMAGRAVLAPAFRAGKAMLARDAVEEAAPGSVIRNADEYIKAINPEGRRVSNDERPNLGMGDMYGMAPKSARQVGAMDVPTIGPVRFVQDGDNFYALAHNPDLGEEDVIGYAMNRGDGTELHVVAEAQGKGIGSELSYLYRSNNPLAQSGGLTDAGERVARKAFNRMREDSAAMAAEQGPSISERPRDTIDVNGPLSPQPGTPEQRAAAAEVQPEDVTGQVGEPLTIFRGENRGNKGGSYYSTDRDFAAQFTQRGTPDEVMTAQLDPSDVYVSDPLPLATKEDQFDAALEAARKAGKKAFRVDEGTGEPNSVYVFDRSGLRSADVIPPLGDSGSWVVVNRETGEPVLETFKGDVARKVNQKKYEVLTAQQYLGRINGKGDIAPQTSAPPIAEQTLGEVAKAGNINLSRIETPEDISTLMRVTADSFGGFEAARRGVQKWEVTQKLADDLGMTPDDLLQRRTGQAMNAEEALATRNLMAASAEETRSLARAAMEGDEEAKAKFVKSFLLHAAITEQAAGAAAEAGRALNIYRKVASAGIADKEAVKEAMKRLQSGADPEEIAAMIHALPDDPSALNRFVREAVKPRFKDKLMFVWINALLSGPKTHIVNMASNLVTAAMDIPEHALAAAIGAPRRALNRNADAVMTSEIGPRFYGMLRGAAEGLASARVAMRSAEAGGKVEAYRPAIGGMAGHVISTPTRLLNAEDEFFKAMARRSELAGIAVRKAKMEGLKGDEFKSRIELLMAHPTEQMLDAAADAALYKTYQQPLGERMTKIGNVINEWQWPKLFVPFMRTPVNLLKYAIERSPAAPFLKEVRAEFMAGGAKRDLAVARMAMGTGVGALVASLAAQGKITGNGPADPSAKKALEANGWQPYSFRVGNEYMSYRRLDPWATVLGTAADMVEMQSAMTEKQQKDTAALLIGATTKNLASKTWLSGLGDLVDALTNPEMNAKSTLTRLGASLATPTLLSQAAQAADPVLRDTNDPSYLGQLRKKIEARIPGLSDNVIARRDIFGREIRDEGGPVDRLTSPFDTRQIRNDPVAKAIYESGARFSVPQRRVGGGDLPDDAYDMYQQLAGQYAHEDIAARIAEDDWSGMDRGARAKEIEKIKNRARKDARADLFGMDH